MSSELEDERLQLPFHRLFIIGAGFSAPAGLPTGKELLERVREFVRLHFRAYGWEGHLEKEIDEWSSLYPGKTIDLERVLAYSHRKHYLRLLGSDEWRDDASRSIIIAREAVQRILIQATPSVPPKLYLDFAKRLGPGDVVLTFNYDTLLEQVFEYIGKAYTLTPEWWLNGRDEAEPEHVDLIKLHGSIDWYDRHFLDNDRRFFAEEGHEELVPNRDPIFGPNPSIPSEPLSKGSTEPYGSRILSRVFRVPNHTQYFPIEGGTGSRIVPFILPPAYDKLLGYEPIRDLWENLHRSHDIYSSIVIIGYSMPPYDSYAYETLGHLLIDYQRGGDETSWGQRRVPVQLITLADSKRCALKGIPFMEPNKTRVWYEGYEPGVLNWIDWGDGSS